MTLQKKIIKILFKIPDPLYFIDEFFINRPNIFQTLVIFLRFAINNKKIHLILILDLLKKIYSLIILILLFPIYFLFFFYLKKKKLILISINTWQIGALIQQLDSIIKNDQNNKYFLICPEYLIEFKNFPKIYNKKNLKYSKSSILYFFVYPFLVFRKFSVDAFDFEVLNNKSKFNKLHSSVSYKYNFKKILNNFESNLNYDYKKLITLHFKDEFFIKGRSTRISNYKSYIKTVKWLLKKKYTVIRFIHSKSKKDILRHNRYHELTTLDENEKIRQFYLIKKSKLFICTQSGPSSYNFIFDTPFLQVNSYPINVSFVTKSKDYLIYKFIKKNGNYINLKQMIEKNFHLHFNSKKKENKGYILEENSSDDIFDATKNILNKNKSYYFSTLLKKIKIQLPASYSMSKIPESFYKKIYKINSK